MPTSLSLQFGKFAVNPIAQGDGAPTTQPVMSTAPVRHEYLVAEKIDFNPDMVIALGGQPCAVDFLGLHRAFIHD